MDEVNLEFADYRSVSYLTDPATGLDMHAAWDSLLLQDILSFEEVRAVLISVARATPVGIDTAQRLIAHARRRGRFGEFATCFAPQCHGTGHTPEWWGNFLLTVRANLFLTLATRDARGRALPGGHVPLVNACKFLAWARGAPYLALRQVLRQRAVSLGEWVERRSVRKTEAGLLLVKES